MILDRKLILTRCAEIAESCERLEEIAAGSGVVHFIDIIEAAEAIFAYTAEVQWSGSRRQSHREKS